MSISAITIAPQKFASPALIKRVVVLALAGAVLASVGVSQLPPDLPFMLPAVAVVWVAVFLALRGHGASSRLSAWLAAPCWAWLVLLAVNPAWSVWPEVSIWTALIIGLLPACVVGLHRLLADDGAWNRLEWFVYGMAVLVAAAMIFEYFGLGLRSDGPFLDANVACAVLYAALLPLLYRMIVALDRFWWLLLALVFVLAVGVFTSFSRGGVGVVIIALVATLVLLVAVGNKAMRRRFACCVLVVVAAWALVYHGPQQARHRNVTNLSQDHSLHVRFLMWQSALDIYADAPLLGKGLGTFVLTYPRYRSQGDTGTAGAMAHNDYLQMLAGSGPLALAFLAAFVLCILAGAVWLFLRLLAVPRSRAGPEHSAMIRDMGLFAALLALAVHAVVNFIFFVPLLALLAALYAARLSGRYGCRERDTRPAGRLWQILRRPVWLLAGLAALVSTVSVASAIITTKTLQQADSVTINALSTTPGKYKLALAVNAVNPLDYRAAVYIALSEANSADLQQQTGNKQQAVKLAATALTDLQHAYTIKHPDCKVPVIKGRLLRHFLADKTQLQQAGVWQDPGRMLRQAITNNPTCMGAWVELAKLRFQQGHEKQAMAVLNHAEKWMNMGNVPVERAGYVLVTLSKMAAKSGYPKQALSILHSVIDQLPSYKPAQEALRKIESRSEHSDQ